MSGFRPESLWTGEGGMEGEGRARLRGGVRPLSVETATPTGSWMSRVHHAVKCEQSHKDCKLRPGKIKLARKLSCDDKKWLFV